MATITRMNLADALRTRFGLTASDANKMIDIIFDEIEQSLIHGEEVKITRFGTFKILFKSARVGRNPKTGERVQIVPKRVPFFKAGKAVKKALNKKNS